jgi:hypothetical protein
MEAVIICETLINVTKYTTQYPRKLSLYSPQWDLEISPINFLEKKFKCNFLKKLMYLIPVWPFRCSGYLMREQGSPVSIVSGYGLDDRANEVRSPVEAKGFFLLPLCPDRFWGPPSFLYNGYRGPFPGGKSRPRCDADHSPPSSAEVENEQELYLSTQTPPWRVVGHL